MRYLAFASCVDLPVPDEDFGLILDECARRGIRTAAIPWTDDLDFSEFDAVVLKSCWDYSDHAEEFLVWAKAVSEATRLLNPYHAVEWNQHKSYLLQLQGAGLDIVPTMLVRAGSQVEPVSDAALDMWGDTIVKPAISAGSCGFTPLIGEGRPKVVAELERHSRTQDVLVQPFLRLTETQGERAIVVLGGEPTHVVRRKWRSNGQLSVSIERVTADDESVVEKVLRAIPWKLPYLRIDLLPDDEDRWLLSEVEAIEPKLYLDHVPWAVGKYVDAILEKSSA